MPIVRSDWLKEPPRAVLGDGEVERCEQQTEPRKVAAHASLDVGGNLDRAIAESIVVGSPVNPCQFVGCVDGDAETAVADDCNPRIECIVDPLLESVSSTPNCGVIDVFQRNQGCIDYPYRALFGEHSW